MESKKILSNDMKKEIIRIMMAMEGPIVNSFEVTKAAGSVLQDSLIKGRSTMEAVDSIEKKT